MDVRSRLTAMATDDQRMSMRPSASKAAKGNTFVFGSSVGEKSRAFSVCSAHFFGRGARADCVKQWPTRTLQGRWPRCKVLTIRMPLPLLDGHTVSLLMHLCVPELRMSTHSTGLLQRPTTPWRATASDVSSPLHASELLVDVLTLALLQQHVLVNGLSKSSSSSSSKHDQVLRSCCFDSSLRRVIC